MALAPGFEQQSDGALEGRPTAWPPSGLLVVDEYPVRRLLLSQSNNLNLASIKRAPRRSGRQDYLNNLDIALLYKIDAGHHPLQDASH